LKSLPRVVKENSTYQRPNPRPTILGTLLIVVMLGMKTVCWLFR